MYALLTAVPVLSLSHSTAAQTMGSFLRHQACIHGNVHQLGASSLTRMALLSPTQTVTAKCAVCCHRCCFHRVRCKLFCCSTVDLMTRVCVNSIVIQHSPALPSACTVDPAVSIYITGGTSHWFGISFMSNMTRPEQNNFRAVLTVVNYKFKFELSLSVDCNAHELIIDFWFFAGWDALQSELVAACVQCGV